MKQFLAPLILGLSLILFLTSCTNVFESGSENLRKEKKAAAVNTKSSTSSIKTPSKKYINLSGEINLSGAYPLSIKEQVEANKKSLKIPAEAVLDTQATEEERARSALPKLPLSTTTEYYVVAKAAGKEDVYGTVDQTAKTYTLANIELNVDWTIEAGLRYRADPDKILMKDSFPKKFTESDLAVTSYSFTLKPNATSGKGELTLEITIPAAPNDTIKKVTAVAVNDGGFTNADTWNSLNIVPAISDNVVTLTHSEVPSGSYNVVFTFWNNENLDIAFPLYTTVQNINIFANMGTTDWADGGNTFGAIDNANGTFIITSSVLQHYSTTQIYVGNPGTVGEGLPGKTPSNSNGGGPYEPLATIEGALSLIEAQNIAANSYTIHISGTYTAAAAGDFVRLENSLNGKAASITLLGQTGLDNAGRPRDIINANTKGSALSINTSVPVTIKNLEIKNGSSTQGGGIYAGTGSKVTLSDGALLSSNAATSEGGAVYVADDAVSFTISGSAKIPYGGSIKNNDVYLSSGKTVNVAGSITSADKTRITPNAWNRNRVVITGTAATSNVNHFQMTDPDFDLVAKDGSIVLSSPIYVAGAAGTGSSLPSGFGFDYGLSKADGGLGTKSHPYVTINEALSEEFTDSSYTGDAVITLVGTYKGNLEISGTTINAGQVIIKAPESGPAAVTDSVTIDANGAGTALTVNTAKPVTIQNIKITGGNAAADNGGGINIEDGSVTLTGNTRVTGNSAENGGGVYIATGKTLVMKGNSKIDANTATTAGGAVYQGGTFQISENAWLPGSGNEKENDVFLKKKNDIVTDNNINTIEVAGELNLQSGATSVATVTPELWKRGIQILTVPEGSSSTLTDVKDYFKVSGPEDDGWENILSDSDKKVIINAPFYIKADGDNTANKGTKSSPFSTIYKAEQFMYNTELDCVINIDGEISCGTTDYARELTGALSDTGGNYFAKSVLLQGANGPDDNGLPKDSIKPASGDTKPGLKIGTEIPVTIQNLLITGASTEDGGGLYLEGNTKVYLKSGV